MRSAEGEAVTRHPRLKPRPEEDSIAGHQHEAGVPQAVASAGLAARLAELQIGEVSGEDGWRVLAHEQAGRVDVKARGVVTVVPRAGVRAEG
ncbi:MAG: hypothetical protein SGPRY_001172 [Prymnesium sp.]